MKPRISLITICLLIALPVTATEIKPIQPSFWEKVINTVLYCKINLKCYFEPKLGVSITTLNATDLIKNSRTDINNNFSNLDAGKIENSTTSIQAITTLSNLVTTGVLASSTFRGSIIEGNFGGTGTSSMAKYRLVFGQGANINLTIATSTGSAGQFLTSNGEGQYPTWQSNVLDQSLTYSWTGLHRFSSPLNASSSLSVATKLNVSSTTPNQNVNLQVEGGAEIGATTTLSTLVVASSTESHNGLTYQMPSTQSINNGMATTSLLVNNGTGGLTWGIPVDFGATNTNPGFTGQQVIPHSLGRIPSLIQIKVISTTDNSGTQDGATSFGIATSTQLLAQKFLSQTIQAAATITYRNVSNNSDIIWLDDAGGVNSVAVALIGLTSTTFTLSWDTNNSQAQEGTRFIQWIVQ